MQGVKAWARALIGVAMLLSLCVFLSGFLSGCQSASGEQSGRSGGASSGGGHSGRDRSEQKVAKHAAADAGDEDEDDDDDDKGGKAAEPKGKHGKAAKDEDDDDKDEAKGGKGGKDEDEDEDEDADDDADDDDKGEAKGTHAEKPGAGHAKTAKAGKHAKPAAMDSGKEFVDTFPEAAADWSSTGSNTYFILQPGYRLILEGKEGGNAVRIEITVLNETKTIDGVETRVVRETESVDGQVKEDTRDYFAFSKKTQNVYYFGEDVDEIRDGKVVGHGGSWHSGENGARYGLMMPGTPVVGYRHYQEVAPGVGMDRAEVVSLSEAFETPAGKFEKCLKTEETTPLEKGVKEFKLYAPGIGIIQDEDAKLVKYGYVK